MPDTLQHVKGLSALQKALDELPVKLERNILRGAMRAGAKVPLEAARRLVPVEVTGEKARTDKQGHATGELRDSLRITTSSRNGTVKASVKAGGKKGWYAHLVEFGTAAHFIRPRAGGKLFFGGHPFSGGVQHPGAVKKPFMRPAFDTTIAAQIAAVAAYIRQRLTKAGIELPSE